MKLISIKLITPLLIILFSLSSCSEKKVADTEPESSESSENVSPKSKKNHPSTSTKKPKSQNGSKVEKYRGAVSGIGASLEKQSEERTKLLNSK